MIEVRNLCFVPPGGAEPVLDDVSFSIRDGERVALLGGNGSGKTTLVRLLNGTLVPTTGSVHVDGFDTQADEAHFEVRRRVGLLFQDPDDQFVTTTLDREVAFGLENLGMPQAQMRAAVDEVLQFFDLLHAREVPPHEMSGGEKARLALACVWVMGPRALLLDETDSLLDKRGAERLTSAIEALPPDTSLLRVTTDASAAADFARMLVLHNGHLLADGPPDEVFGTLPAEVVARIDTPLAWELSQELRDRGVPASCTVSWRRLLAELQGHEMGASATPQTEPRAESP